MLFALLCTDKPNAIDLRMKVRPEHLAYLESLGVGDESGRAVSQRRGIAHRFSLVIIEAADRKAAEAMAANDPYAKAGLFASVEIKAWRWALKNPEAK